MDQTADPIAEQVTAPILVRQPLADSQALSVRSYGLTDIGKVRDRNEDQFLIAELTKAMRVQQSSMPQPNTKYSDQTGHLFIVADGMGGQQGGDRASALAVETVEEFMLNTMKWFFQLRSEQEKSVLEEFQLAMRQADARILAEAYRHPELRGMGTTLTMAYHANGQLFIVHVGGSRCYLERAGALHRLTHDHTLVQEMVRHHALTPEQAARHDLRHVITSCVGGNKPGVQIEVHRVTLAPGDTMLLCSDGLTEMLSDERILAIMTAESDPKASCERLISEANAKKSQDNLTAIVARFDSSG